MRIIAGKFRSIGIETIKGNETRPTADKVKEAIFSSIGPYFDGGIVLDLYAGSGAIGLEAISRGFDKAVFVDNSNNAIQVIKKNIDKLKVNNQTLVLKKDAKSAINSLSAMNYTFDLVYLDPPYRFQQNEALIRQLYDKNLLSDNSKIIVESLKEDAFFESYEKVVKIKEVCYGITKITMYEVRL